MTCIPKELIYPLHLPDGKDLVLDLLPPRGYVVRHLRRVGDSARLALAVRRGRVFQLLTRAYVQDRDQHLDNCARVLAHKI